MRINILMLACFLVFHTAPLYASESLLGEWRFSEIRKAEFPPDAMTPPLFDIVTFNEDGTVLLHHSLRNAEFVGHYEIHDSVLTWRFEPSDAPQAIEHGVHFSFSKRGGLILRGAQATDSSESSAEWIFFRPSVFLPNERVAGTWEYLNDKGEVEATRVLLPSGQLGDDDSVWGVYRLWDSGSGPVLTTIMWVQGSGAYAMFERVGFRENCIVLDGRVPPGVPPQLPKTWCRAESTTNHE